MREKQPVGPHTVAGYSFGATVAVEVALQLQAAGDKCSLVLLDGSHAYVRMFTDKYVTEGVNDEEKQVSALTSFADGLLGNQQQVIDWC